MCTVVCSLFLVSSWLLPLPRSSHELDGAVSSAGIHGAVDELDTARGANKRRGGATDEATVWDKTNYAGGRTTAKDR